MYELKTFNDIQDKLEENLLNFFDKHLSRWAGYFESDRPTVELHLLAPRVLMEDAIFSLLRNGISSNQHFKSYRSGHFARQ